MCPHPLPVLWRGPAQHQDQFGPAQTKRMQRFMELKLRVAGDLGPAALVIAGQGRVITSEDCVGAVGHNVIGGPEMRQNLRRRPAIAGRGSLKLFLTLAGNRLGNAQWIR
jgi:hypothetical protein